MKRIRIAAILAAAVFCLWGCGGSGETAEKQQALKQEGMQLQMSGDYDGAIAKYEEALSLSDMKVGEAEIDIAYYKASAQYANGDLEGAIDTYSAILKVKTDENSYLGRGLLYAAAGEIEKAEEDLNKALSKADDPLTQGLIYSAAGDTEKAKECFEKARKAGDSKAAFYLADIYEQAGDTEYAATLLEEYIASGDAGAEGYLEAGRHYFEQGGYEKALEAIQEGIALGASGVLKSLLEEEVACYEKLGDYEEAKEKAAAYLESYPDDAAMQKEYEFLKSR